MRPRQDVQREWQRGKRVCILGPTRQLSRTAQQIHFLPVAGREHLDQHFISGITGERIPRLENRLVDRAQARLELGDGFRRERSFLLIEQILKHARGSEVVVLLDREGGESSRRCFR